jgi:hypothetical protein
MVHELRLVLLTARWTRLAGQLPEQDADQTLGTTTQISLPERSDDTPLQDLTPHSYEPAPTEDPEEAATVGADIETSSLLRAPSPSPAAADGYGVAGAAYVNHDSELHSPLSASAASSGSHAAHFRNNISTSLSPQTVSPTLLLLYSNAITSLIGLCTLVLLWIPIPLLHWIGWEEFQVPPKEAGFAMVGIILGGIGTFHSRLGAGCFCGFEKPRVALRYPFRRVSAVTHALPLSLGHSLQRRVHGPPLALGSPHRLGRQPPHPPPRLALRRPLCPLGSTHDSKHLGRWGHDRLRVCGVDRRRDEGRRGGGRGQRWRIGDETSRGQGPTGEDQRRRRVIFASGR